MQKKEEEINKREQALKEREEKAQSLKLKLAKYSLEMGPLTQDDLIY